MLSFILYLELKLIILLVNGVYAFDLIYWILKSLDVGLNNPNSDNLLICLLLILYKFY